MSGLPRFVAVARREYLERVKTKAFVIATVIGPLLMAGLLLGPALLASRQRDKPQRLALVAASEPLRKAVEQALTQRRERGEPRFIVARTSEGPIEAERAKLRQEVLAGQLDGYLYLPPDVLETSNGEYYGKSVSNLGDMRTLERTVEEALVAQRLIAEGVAAGRVKSVMRRLDIRTIRITERGEREDRGVTFIFASVMMMMLYISVIMWGQGVMTGVIEEKSNRVVELAISAMPAWHLLAGKLLGVGSAGLTQFLVWAASMALISLFGGPVLAAGEIPMPEITPLMLVSFVVFFLLGYFLYAALYAAVGSAVNTIQEAQSLAFPVLSPLILSMIFFPVVLRSPESPLAVGLSLFPMATPLLMFLRITVLTPPLWQIGLSIVLTLLTIALVTWASARIYRVGILMYGKRPTFPELLRWVRHS
jgi:ABC-2 type transport system permease protein